MYSSTTSHQIPYKASTFIKMRPIRKAAPKTIPQYAQIEAAVVSPITINTYQQSDSYQTMKRYLDIFFTSILLILLSPVMLAVAIAIKLDSKGPIFYHQTRIGRWGKPFTCLKLRSMHIDADEIKKQLATQNEADGPVFKMKNDPRITRIGRIIRKLSLDELPQLFNVLAGEMSLVGPRPAIPTEVLEYGDRDRLRLEAVPGLTGLQQISGRSDLDFSSWIDLDLEYIENQSFATDLSIMLKTIPTVLSGQGAY